MHWANTPRFPLESIALKTETHGKTIHTFCIMIHNVGRFPVRGHLFSFLLTASFQSYQRPASETVITENTLNAG